MPLRLDSQSADFPTRFRAFLGVKRDATQDVEQAVRAIIADVRARGDRALTELTAKYDGVDLAKAGLRVTAAEINAADKACDAEALAADRIVDDEPDDVGVAKRRADADRDEDQTNEVGAAFGAQQGSDALELSGHADDREVIGHPLRRATAAASINPRAARR